MVTTPQRTNAKRRTKPDRAKDPQAVELPARKDNGTGSDRDRSGISADTQDAATDGAKEPGEGNAVRLVQDVSLVSSELKKGDIVQGKTLSGVEVTGSFLNLTMSGMLFVEAGGKQFMLDPAKSAIVLPAPAEFQPDEFCSFKVGDTVESSEGKRGKITKLMAKTAKLNPRAAVEWEDGTKSSPVALSRIKKAPSFAVGDRVVIRQKGHPDLHGRIIRLNSESEASVYVDEFSAATLVMLQFLFRVESAESNDPQITEPLAAEELEAIEPENKQSESSAESEPVLPTAEEIEAALIHGNPFETIATLLSNIGFVTVVPDQDFYPDGEPEAYRSWQVITESNTGSLMAISICRKQDQWYSLPAETDDWDFGYSGHQAAIDWAKRLIDRLIEAGEKASGQLSLLETITPVEVVADARDRLTQLEADIQEGLNLVEQGKSKIWQAVAAVRSEKLWQLDGHTSFEAYCKSRWGWEKSNAHEVAQAGEVVTGLLESGIPESQLPDSVSQVRELSKILPEKRAEVLQRAAAQTEGKPTAKAIREATTPEEVQEKYRKVEDVVMPQLAELKVLYEAIGIVRDWKDGFTVERPDLGNPFPLAFKNRTQAWDYWQRHKEKLQSLAERKPIPDAIAIAPEIQTLKSNIQTLEPHPQECWHQCFVVVKSSVRSFSNFQQKGWSDEAIESLANQVIEFLSIAEV